MTDLSPKVKRETQSPNGDETGGDDAQKRGVDHISVESMKDFSATGEWIGNDVPEREVEQLQRDQQRVAFVQRQILENRLAHVTKIVGPHSRLRWKDLDTRRGGMRFFFTTKVLF